MVNPVVSNVSANGQAQLTPCDLMTPYGDIDPGQHGFR